MFNQKGFTLLEVIIAIVIIGILAAIAVPNYTTSIRQGAAKAAQNNLISIYGAQKNYYLGTTGNGQFYISSQADDLVNINSTLGLNITDTNFKYTCAVGAIIPSYTCTATNNSDAALILTITSGTPNVPNQIILPGGSTCPNNTGANPGCNPSCVSDNSNVYCPTS